MNWSTVKDIAEAIQAFTTSIAIIIGGYWSYKLFVQKRQRYPRANISHLITHIPIDSNKMLMRVVVTIANKGDVLLVLNCGETRIQQVMPVPENIVEAIQQGYDPVEEGETEILWPLLERRVNNWVRGTFEIEPNETDELHYDFIIDRAVEAIIVYSYFRNTTKYGRIMRLLRQHHEVGWSITTTYQLERPSTHFMEEPVSQNKDSSNKVVQPDGTKQQPPKPIPQQPATIKPAQTGTPKQSEKLQQSSQRQQQHTIVMEQQRLKPVPPKVQISQNKSSPDNQNKSNSGKKS